MVKILTARWVLPITSPPIESGALAIEDDRIVATGRSDEIITGFPSAEILDLGEAAILPGLVNIHSHLELTGFRGRLEETRFQSWIAQLIRIKNEDLDRDDLLHFARAGCLEAIRAGITTLADTTDSGTPLEAIIESGLRGIIYQEFFGPQPEVAETSLDDLQRKLDLHFKKISQAGATAASRLGIGISPHAPYSVSARLFERAARLAVDHRLDLAIHAAESLDEKMLLTDGSGDFAEMLRRREIRFDPPGCSTIEYFHRLGVLDAAPLLIHCVQVEGEDLELMARHSVRVAHCPKSNAKFGHGVAPLLEMQRAGIRVGLGSDSVASNNTVDLIEEARFAALIHRAAGRDPAACTASQMLRLATLDGARALGLDDRIGSLEPGKQADIIAVNLSSAHNSPHYDPETALIFSCSGRDVILTMVAGQTLYDVTKSE